jgi:histidinol-phosphate aminotransferase
MSSTILFRDDLADRRAYPSASGTSEQCVRLHCNENPWPPGDSIDSLLNRYPRQQPEALRARLAELYQTAPENLLIARGADDAIDLVIRGFCRPGIDAIAQCPPTFVMYAFFAGLHGSKVLDVPLTDDNWSCETAGLRDVADRGARVIFVCTPNNPTGNVIDSKDVIALARDVAGKSMVVADEAYDEFSDRPSRLAGEVESQGNLILLRTLSKAWSLAGARLGIIIAAREVIEYLQRAVLPPFPLARPVVEAALAALRPEHQDMVRARIADIVARREVLRARLAALPRVRRVWPSQGNFLLAEFEDAAEVVRYCQSHGYLLRDLTGQPRLGNHLRITVGTSAEVDGLLETLVRFGESA